MEYEELIMLKYGIELQGWTFKMFKCPSDLSTSIQPLQELLNAINNGKCRFVKLTAVEVKRRREECQKQISDGTIAVKQQKQHSDIGKKRSCKGKGKAPGGDTVDTNEEECPRKRQAAKSNEVVNSDED